ncbi:hypothetical protein [Pelomonas sp. BJYL3]|uniref:hypothetical protein n=1 Tax=Pelomonas sp. BJYL3 TaxID=2976697 RepID=UPI0022B5CE48|nr:hypothetical protein [Pelomonas sp. BJYL3]
MKHRVQGLVWLGLALAGAAQADPCLTQLPRSLQASVAAQAPQYRLPSAGDYPDAKGACPGVLRGRWGGKTAVAVVLPSRDGAAMELVLAQPHASSWQLEVLLRPSRRDRLPTLSTAPAGRYLRTPALAEGMEPGEQSPLACAVDGLRLDSPESAAAVFCPTSAGWRHVWVSD